MSDIHHATSAAQSVAITPITQPIYIGMGSNLCRDIDGHSLTSIQILQQAAHALQAYGDIRVSCLYQSKPMGPADQPDYFNAVLKLTPRVALNPFDWLALLQQLEQQAGRVKLRHWGERTLDLDLVYVGDDDHWLALTSDMLTIPHMGALARSFVVKPLLDLNPNFDFAGQLLTKNSYGNDASLIKIANDNWVDLADRSLS